jgi:hypothetical protein
MKTFLQRMGRLGATVAGTDPCSTGGHPKTSTERKRRLQMNKFRFTIKVLAIAIFTLAFASMTQAQATRTWVSGVGDDVNPCSRTAPCKTFAGAIGKTADGGEIDALDPGGFGAVTITKGITIDGGGSLASILHSATQGVIINDGTNTKTVTLRRLSINGAGVTLGTNAVNILTAGKVNIQNCFIFGSSGNGITDNRTASGVFLTVTDTKIYNFGGDGIHIGSGSASGTTAQIDGCDISNVGIGVFAKTAAVVSIRHLNASNNTTGLQSDTGAVVVVMDSNLSGNTTGILNSGGATRLSNVTIVACGTGVNVSAGAVTGFSNNTIAGNGAGNVVSSSVIQQ